MFCEEKKTQQQNTLIISFVGGGLSQSGSETHKKKDILKTAIVLEPRSLRRDWRSGRSLLKHTDGRMDKVILRGLFDHNKKDTTTTLRFAVVPETIAPKERQLFKRTKGRMDKVFLRGLFEHNKRDIQPLCTMKIAVVPETSAQGTTII